MIQSNWFYSIINIENKFIIIPKKQDKLQNVTKDKSISTYKWVQDIDF